MNDPAANARPSAAFLAAATRYLRRYVARHFNGLRIERSSRPPVLDGPTVFYCNHPSWWDPVVLLLLIRAHYPERSFHGVIDAAALRRYPCLRRLGLFGIEPGTVAGARRLIERGTRVLAEPRGGLVLTPQGSFSDARERPVILKGGLARLLWRNPSAAAIPIAIEYVFWNERLPEILVRFGRSPVVAAGRTRSAVHAALERTLEAELDTLAAAAASRDEARFESLVDGHAGIGFWQDLPLRLRALVTGGRFDPAHSAVGRRPR